MEFTFAAFGGLAIAEAQARAVDASLEGALRTVGTRDLGAARLEDERPEGRDPGSVEGESAGSFPADSRR
jgi:hypothetical protein